jgi:superfamily II DNA or RNA helicase
VQTGEWCLSVDHGEVGQVVSVETVWGQQTLLLWLPTRDLVVQIPACRLRDIEAAMPATTDQLVFAAAAARIADALGQDTLVAPMGASVIPLPHQLHALSRAMSGDRVRYLLADEVGLGKTIEAGLILREMKMRGLVSRTLVVAPAGLVTQWVSEMRTHFNEDFRLVIPGSFSVWRDVTGAGEMDNLWRIHDQVVCPVDSVKPMEARRGWSHEQVARYNRERFDDLVSAGWDLIIVDEAHRLGGSTEQVARFKLGEALSEAAPYLLLLTATPHQGKTDAFRRLISFLDPDALPDDESVRRENVAPYVIRTEKRRAIDASGNALFKPRVTKTHAVVWDETRHEQRALYDAVTEYVREGYNQALRDKRTAIGFLMILMQRLVTSSTAAIRRALERRLEVLDLPDGQLSLFPEDIGYDWSGLDSQDQMEKILTSRLRGLKNERAEVELLLSAARRCEARGPDVKAEALLEIIRQLQRDENDPSLKVLVFTEFVPTQAMLAEFLGGRGFSVACLNGSMAFDQRSEVQRAFANEAQVMISTDAGGEGLNLQFCHVVVNYDLPWNPMKIEQRIGRVDRIGQQHVVTALNFALADTVELRVREVLEEKLQRILEEFGVDKLGDVLDSEEGDVDFDTLFIDAVITPEQAAERATELAEQIRRRAQAARDGSRVLGAVEELDPSGAKRIENHQMPFWTERMTVSHLRTLVAEGAAVSRDDVGYRLRWPDGFEVQKAVFTRQNATLPGTTHLSLEGPRVRRLVALLPHFAPGQPIVELLIPGVSDKVEGVWSLWRIRLRTEDERKTRVLPLFVSDDGRALGPTARAVWDRLIEGAAVLSDPPAAIKGEPAARAYEASRREAESHGKPLFVELQEAHRTRNQRERRKALYAIESRRRAIGRVGLPQVRSHRLAQLEREQHAWATSMAAKEAAVPELSAILLLRVVSTGDHE